MQKTYIVTGAGGFIGSHMADKLLQSGNKVIAVDNFETGKVENLNVDNENFVLYQKDISDTEQVNDLISILGHLKVNVEGVFHVAAKARIQPSIKNPGRTIASNVVGTFNILELCRALKIQNLVYSASSSVYGLTDKLPNQVNDEDNCLNPYAVSKFVGEKLCSTWSRCYGINTVSLRYFNVYGERSQLVGPYAPVIGIFFRQLFKEKTLMTIVGDGEQKRDFTHVADVVDANLLAMNKCDENSGKTFNIGCGKNYSINQVAAMIGGDFIHIAPRPGEARETIADISETMKCLDWQPTIDLTRGIEIMRKHYEGLFGAR